MRHAYIKGKQFAEDMYNVVNSSTFTTTALVWNPEQKGGHLHCLLGARGATFNVTLDPAYTPAEGDIIKITVTKNDFYAANITLTLDGVYPFVVDESNSPVTFIAKRDEYLGTVEWHELDMRYNSRDEASASAFGELRTTSLNCSYGDTGVPSCSHARQTYVKRLDSGFWVACVQGWGGSSIYSSSLFYGAKYGNQLRQISHATAGTGQLPWTVRTVIYANSRILVLGDSYGVPTDNGGYTYSITQSGGCSYLTKFAFGGVGFDKHACAPSVNGARVLCASRGSAVGIWYSDDYGVTWTQVLTTDATPVNVLVTQYYMYYSNANGIYRSSLGAVNSWTQVLAWSSGGAHKGGLLRSFASQSGQQGLSALGDGRWWFSPDNGSTWTGGWYGPYVNAFYTGVEIGAIYPNSGWGEGEGQIAYTRDFLFRTMQYSCNVGYGHENASFDSYYTTAWESGYSGVYLVGGSDASDAFYQDSAYLGQHVTCTASWFPWSANLMQ